MLELPQSHFSDDGWWLLMFSWSYDYICVIPILLLQVLYIYIYIWYMICVIFVISKRRSSLGQTIVKIIHKMKRMVKFVKKWILTPSSYAHSFLSTTKHLGKIRLHIGFTPFANYSVNVFWTNQNLIVLQKCPIFFLFTASKNIKNHKEKFEVGCSYKDCNQFLLPKNYRLWN